MRVLIFAIVVLVAPALTWAPWVESLDRALLDAQFKFLRSYAPRNVERDVVIVGIDDETAQALREPVTLWHPHLGKFLLAVASAEAAVAGLDVVLPDRSFDGIVPGYDRQLLAGILGARRSIPLVLALTVDPSGATRPIYPAFVAAAGADSTGYALLPVDDDGIVRRFDDRIAVSDGAVPTLAGQMAERVGRESSRGYIDYTVGKPFDYIPLHSVLDWYDARDVTKLKSALGGKAILLGGVFRFEDRLGVPVNLLGWDPQAINAPGVVVHAQALRNMLNDGLIAPVSRPVIMALCVLAAIGGWVAFGFTFAALALIAGNGVLLIVSTWMLTRGRDLAPAAPMVALTIAVASRLLYEASLQLRERQRLRVAFAAYVSPRIMQDLLRSVPPPGLGGQRYRLCVLFADIRGFTERSEAIAPEATIRLLNRYFSEVTASIHDAGGTLDKFIGDGVMAFFGAPQRLDNPCIPAFDAARDMLDRVSRLNDQLMLEGEAPISIGVGLHVGDTVVGNIGSKARYNYTAIGDTVNVASRLEGLTKELDWPLVCSAKVFDALEERAGFVKLGRKAIKGHQPVDVYGWRPNNVGVPPTGTKTT